MLTARVEFRGCRCAALRRGVAGRPVDSIRSSMIIHCFASPASRTPAAANLRSSLPKQHTHFEPGSFQTRRFSRAMKAIAAPTALRPLPAAVRSRSLLARAAARPAVARPVCAAAAQAAQSVTVQFSLKHKVGWRRERAAAPCGRDHCLVPVRPAADCQAAPAAAACPACQIELGRAIGTANPVPLQVLFHGATARSWRRAPRATTTSLRLYTAHTLPSLPPLVSAPLPSRPRRSTLARRCCWWAPPTSWAPGRSTARRPWVSGRQHPPPMTHHPAEPPCTPPAGQPFHSALASALARAMPQSQHTPHPASPSPAHPRPTACSLVRGRRVDRERGAAGGR